MQNTKITVLLLLSIILGGVLCAGCTSPVVGESGTPFQKGTDASLSSGRSPATLASGAVSPSQSSPGSLPAGDQKIIKTADVSLEVRDVGATRDSLQSIATSHGGYVGSLSLVKGSNDRLYGSLVMRVPSNAFDAALSSVMALGTVRSQSIQADDITEEYVDLQARRSALGDQLQQYRRIMEKAGNVSEVLLVQREIERVQVEIDRIDGRLKYLSNRVDYATITITFSEPEPVGVTKGPSIASVINDAIKGFLEVAAALFILLVSLLPLIVLGLVAWVTYRWWKGRQNGRNGKKNPDDKGPS